MDMVDSTVVNVAIPRLSQDFHAPISSVEWTVTGYLLSLALFIPAAGYFSDRFGTKRCFLIAMGIFVAASGLCGQAHSLPELIVFRFLQGAGGGMMTPVGTAMLSREFPGAERAKASALISVPIVFAPMVGPILGGYLVTSVSWRWIFYLNLPIGMAAFAFALRVLKEHKEEYARKGFDFIGLVTGSGSAALILYALSEAANSGWTSGRVLGFGITGVAVLGVFVLQENRTKTPIIDLGLFRRPLFVQGNLIMMPAFAMFTGFFFIFTLYLQELQGWSAFQAGLITAPASLVAAGAFPLASMYYHRIGPKKMLLIGSSLSFLTLLPFGFLTAGTVVAILIPVLCVRALPFSFASVAAQTIIYGPLESSKQGPASSAYNAMRQVAASLGVALIATVQANQFKGELGSLTEKAGLSAPTPAITRLASQHGYQMAFFAAAALMFIPLVVTFFVDNRKAVEALSDQMETREVVQAAGTASVAETGVTAGK